jgi:hypothetical protein
MIIANIKSQQDLQGKRNIQQQLLDVASSNEAELEKRVKDYKNPNKPLAVAPEYKTNAQLQADRLAQEKQAIVNMSELGFDYNKSADLVAWLSSSLINKLVEFNANFKGIKKELTETTNPKLINLDFLKNYLEKYFEDLDVNFGRKFSSSSVQGISATSSVDELTDLLPSPENVGGLRDRFIQLSAFTREQKLVPAKRALHEIRQALAERIIPDEDVRILPERQRREYKEIIKEGRSIESGLLREISTYTEVASKCRLVSILLQLYQAIIPSAETFLLLKTSLTQQERADLIRRYMGVLRGLKILSRSGVLELIDEAEMITSREETYDMVALERLANKTIKALAFVSNDNGVNQISKLQRDYEIVLQQSGKIGDLDKITRLNEIREGEIQRAREVLSNFTDRVDDEDEEFIMDIRRGQKQVRIRQSDPRDVGNTSLMDLGTELMLRDEAVAELGRDRAEALLEQQRLQNNQLHTQREAEIVGALRQGIQGLRRVQPPQQRNPAEALEDYKKLASRYYSDFIREIDARFAESGDAGILMLEHFLFDADKLGIPRNEKPVRKGKSNDDYYELIKAILMRWIKRNRIDNLRLDFDFAQPTIVADYYRNNNTKYSDGRQTIKGVGMATKLRKHFKKDEAELRAVAKALEDHESEEEKIDGGALKFRHTRVKVGKGISVKQAPSYKTFGKYVIHMGHLLDKNVANFKYPSLGSIPSIKPLTISEEYKEFIIDTLESGKPNERLMSKLPAEEQRHFEKVVMGAGLIDTFKLKRNQGETEKKEANRFNLLRGEVLAGNNNEKVMKELRGLILRFMSDGRIQQKEGTSMLVELSAL